MSKVIPDWRKASIFESIFDQLSDALVLYDADLLITGVNRSAEKLLGKSCDKMLGKHWQEVLQPVASGPELFGGAPAPAQNTLCLHVGGLERLVLVQTCPVLDDRGQLAGGAATIRDVGGVAAPLQHAMIAESSIMLKILAFVRRIAASAAGTILLEGESGTGKDLIAKMLHYQSARQSEPFIAVNCAAIPETLLESELFGYERGAFTDARAQKRGIFELADRGTLFLDEIGEIPMVLQAKLLRVLEEQSFRRLGGLADIQLDLRIVAATNKNLRAAVTQNAFRQDLYFRLNVIQITIPPLRERAADIPPLAAFFVDRYNRRFKRRIEGLSDHANQLLLAYNWPGNVRELCNAIERGMILEESSRIQSASLPATISRTGEVIPARPLGLGVSKRRGSTGAGACSSIR